MRLLPAFAAAAFLAACASKGQSGFAAPACNSMNADIREKQKLDAEVKTLTRQVREYRAQGDTATASGEGRRLALMLENQRLLKESLDQNSRDCASSSQVQDPLPVQGPASRDPSTRGNLPPEAR